MSGFIGNGNTTIISSGGDGYGGVVQSLFVDLIQDAYSTAVEPNFSTLLSKNITTSGGDILANFSASFGSNTTLDGVIFRMLVDGVVEKTVSCSCSTNYSFETVSLILQKSVSLSTHTISIEWAKNYNSNEFTCIWILADKYSGYHSSLIIQEIK